MYLRQVTRTLLLAAILCMTHSIPASALDHCWVPHGQTYTINEHSTCRRVTNNHASGVQIFVPTKSAAEWSTGANAFINATPPGVTIAACPSASGWNFTRKLTASDGVAGDRFGTPIAVSDDGTLIAIAAPSDDASRGSAYLFNTSTGVQLAKIVASDGVANDKFGDSIDISPDKTKVVVGVTEDDSQRGAAYVFNASTGAQLLKLIASDRAANDDFGIRVTFSPDSSKILIGAYGDDTNRGSAYLFDATTGSQITKYIAADRAGGDRFGADVAFSPDGSKILVGALNDDTGRGSAYILNTSNGAQVFKLLASDRAASDRFGISVDWSPVGNFAIIGADRDDTTRGAAYVFDTSTGAQLRKIVAADGAANENFGQLIELGSSGQLSIISAHAQDPQGSAYLFDPTTGAQLFKFNGHDTITSDAYGTGVTIDNQGTTIGIGALGQNSSTGSVYIYKQAGSNPSCSP